MVVSKVCFFSIKVSEFGGFRMFCVCVYGSDMRKRGRETVATLNTHQFPLQSQLFQQQHYQSQSNMVFTGLRLSSGEDQTQKISDWSQQQSIYHRNLVSDSSSSGFLSVLSEDVFDAYVTRQREEIDEFIHSQAAELQRTLAEKMKRHYKTLLSGMEEALASKLKEKEAEVDRATRRYDELAAQLKTEVRAWQAKARAEEAAVVSLQAQMQLIKNNCYGGDGGVAEERMFCATGISGSELRMDDAESAYVDPERMTEDTRWPKCKICRKRVAMVVLLPCRHLSLCPECDQRSLACPICLALRNSSIEAIQC